MDTQSACKILGVSEKATIEEIRARYRKLAKQWHPDMPTGNSNQFLLISAAFTLLNNNAMNFKGSNVPDEVLEAAALKKQVNENFEAIHESYLVFRKNIEKTTRKYIKQAIYSTNSSDDLKTTLNKQVAQHLVDVSTQLSSYFKTVMPRLMNEQDFLYQLFQDIYKARRKYFLLNLYRDPIVFSGTVIYITRAFIMYYPTIQEKIPEIWAILGLTWIPIAIIFIIAMYTIIQFYRLSPHNQFVPPRLSLVGIHTCIKEQMSKVQSTKGESSFGGAILGTIVGSVVAPGIGTVIGAAIGTVFGWFFGEKLEKMQDKAFNAIMSEFDAALEQIDISINTWVIKSKDDVYKATLDSFEKNYKKVAGFLNTSQGQRFLLKEKN